MSSPKKIVLLCVGSFNPPTNKHLRIMELARDKLHKTGRYKVVSGLFSPVHDSYPKKGLLSAKHRIAMLRLATASSDWLTVNTYETEQKTWMTTRDALDAIQNNSISKEYGGEPSNKKRRFKKTESQSEDSPLLKLVCGADLLESFQVPGLWSEEDMRKLAGEYGIVVISREGSSADNIIYNNDILAASTHNIELVTDWFGDDLSSTKVRRAITRNESVKYLMDDKVIDYIREHKLYNACYQPGSTQPHLQ